MKERVRERRGKKGEGLEWGGEEEQKKRQGHRQGRREKGDRV